ncbi:prephenate dehydrogenase [Antrihabitans cavernicola]|uniref:Prephenate dehydrogenase n=1 Tax=Antrihabitans cavernicola TaxID=2495913 RepID=A0A5A7SLC5_9NOCA|nr:prephenate dehydrogenase [Spelaeibacter cavernicola]KAA0025041.1 prephenate dehydrogenase [Spelaeibacter cavernicola]
MCQPVLVSDQRETSVCVLGLGLIGGSVVRAAADAGRTVWGYNRSSSAVVDATAEGFDAADDLPAVLQRAQREHALIVIAVPMPAVDSVLTAITEHAPDCALTDVVSVKAEMLSAVERHGLAARYVGGHPMAGTSESGWAASTADLFHDAVWVVGTEADADPIVWSQVAQLALDCGSVVIPAESVEHDRAVARISHLPHLLAEALALSGAAGGDLALTLAAGSFRDGTRVAGTAPDLVRAMCEANSTALLIALDETVEVLKAARMALAAAASTADLVTAGHAAHTRYTHRQRWDITDITPGDDGWQDALRKAGRRGGALRAL